MTTVFNGQKTLATNISLANATGNIVATFISVILMHKVGRKGFMIISLAGMTIASVFLVIGSASAAADQLAGLVITAGKSG